MKAPLQGMERGFYISCKGVSIRHETFAFALRCQRSGSHGMMAVMSMEIAFWGGK